jgi:WD40 repeat protein
VQALAFSPDGKTLASGSADLTVRLWEATTGKELRRLQKYHGEIDLLTFSPDNKNLAVAGESVRNKIQLWDVVTGKLLRQLDPYHDQVLSLTFSPDGVALVSSGGDHTIRVHDVAMGRELLKLDGRAFHAGSFISVALSSDGKLLAAGLRDKTIAVWDARTGERLHHLGASQQWDVRDPFPGGLLKFLPDNTTLLMADWHNNVWLWDMVTGGQVLHFRTSGGRNALAFSRDGKLLATAPNRRIALWDTTTGKELPQRLVHGTQIHSLAFRPDGKVLAGGGADSTIHFWDVATGKRKQVLDGPTGRVSAVVHSPNGRFLLLGSLDGKVQVWNASTATVIRQLASHESGVHSLAVTADGKLLGSSGGDGIIRLTELSTGQVLFDLKGHNRYARCVAFSPDGALLASGGEDGVIKLWDARTGKRKRELTGHKKWIEAIVFAPDGRILASAAYDGTVRFWDIESGSETGQIAAGEVWSLRFSPDGRSFATVGNLDNGVHLWETATRKERCCFKGHTYPPHAVTFTPDGRTLVSGGQDRTVRLWDIAAGQELCSFRGHQGFISCLSVSPDGNTIASGSADTTTLIWDIAPWIRKNRSAEGNSSPSDVRRAWADLESEEAPKAHAALWALVNSPKEALSLLKQELRPAASPDPRRLAQLLGELENSDFAAREAATRELKTMGESAEASLRKALASNPSAEARRRLEDLLRRLELQLFTADDLRTLRAIEALEHIGNEEAQQLLETLAQGPRSARQTREASASLQRLRHRLSGR